MAISRVHGCIGKPSMPVPQGYRVAPTPGRVSDAFYVALEYMDTQGSLSMPLSAPQGPHRLLSGIMYMDAQGSLLCISRALQGPIACSLGYMGPCGAERGIERIP